MSIQKTKHRFLAVAAAILLTALMTLMLLPASAFAAENQAVTGASNGVFQVNLVYRDDGNVDHVISYGSGFLVNSDTIVTCDHVVVLPETDIEILSQAFGKSKQEIRDRIKYTVTVSRDVSIDVSQIVNHSQEMDWAVLKLNQSIQGKTPLSIRSSASVQQTEKVYAIGFPTPSSVMQDINTYTSDDVTITEGTVNKVATGLNIYMQNYYGMNVNFDYIQTSAMLRGGNSGGPMVDENGNVIGVCQASYSDYFIAVAVDQVSSVLDALGIEYTKEGAIPTPTGTDEPETEAKVDKAKLASAIKDAKKIEEKGYTKESFSAMKTALDEAEAVNDKEDATQDEVDKAAKNLTSKMNALEVKKGLDLKWIIIIAAGVVVIAAVIVIIAVLASKKKKQKKLTSPEAKGMGAGTIPMAPPTPQGGFTPPPAPQGGFTPPPAAPVGDAGETTVLSSDAGETTVLSQNINGGSLVSAKTGEKIPVNTAEFTIGRERTKVNYCISGNTSVGRVHAKIVNRNGVAYLVDMKATNGTFVNGVKCTPMQEVQLKSGDKIAFSNEEYTYQA